MQAHHTVILLFGLLLTVPNAAAPSGREAIDAVFQADRTVPAPWQDQESQALPEAHDYLFERYAGMAPGDFLDALPLVLQKYPAPAEPGAMTAYERDMGHKLGIIFEYFPLAARTHDDFLALLELIFQRDTPDVLRVFLLRQGTPGLDPASPFSLYLQGHLDVEGEDFAARLKELIQLPQESVPVQMAAMDTLLARIDHDYATLIARDPVASSISPAGEDLQVRHLITDPEGLKLSRRTQILLERKNGEVGIWASALKALAANGQRDRAVRDKAGEVLEAILRDYPVSGRDALTATP